VKNKIQINHISFMLVKSYRTIHQLPIHQILVISFIGILLNKDTQMLFNCNYFVYQSLQFISSYGHQEFFVFDVEPYIICLLWSLPMASAHKGDEGCFT
jgi:hypothetical protein